jgi:glycosyltransferase involved in cell wall biosynthesis
MKRIGINITPLDNLNSGTGQYLFNLLKNIAHLDKNNTYFLYADKEIRLSFENHFQIRTIPQKIPIKRYFFQKYIWEKFTLPKFILQDNLTHFFSPYATTTRLKNISHTITVHDTIPDVFPTYLRNFFQKFYYHQTQKAAREASRIITISNFSKKEIHRFFKIPLEKIYSIYLGIDQTIYQPQNLPKENFIFYVGGLDLRKNISSLIKAIPELKKNFPNLKLIIMGKLPLNPDPLIPDYQKIIKELDLQKSIQFTTGDDQKKAKLLSRAQIFVWPSFYEGFGLPPLEALSLKTLVLSSKKSSMPEILKDRVTYLENPQDPTEIAQKIKKILSLSPEEKEKITEEGFSFSQKYNWEKCAHETLKIILS